MIGLYAAATSNGMRAKIMLDECGLPYQLRLVDLAKGEQTGPDYLALNPMGLIPVIIDSDGAGGKPLKVAQSAAILLYLGKKTGKYLPANEAAFGPFHDALMNVATDVSMTFSALLALVRSPEPHEPSQKILERRLRHYLSVWDERLSQQRCCFGDEVTIIDFALYTVFLRCNQLMPQLCEGLTHLNRWGKEIGARPGVIKGINFDAH
ncbi:MAG: glutathione S-transferase family protein [Xanthobacteraceae bacterium]